MYDKGRGGSGRPRRSAFVGSASLRAIHEVHIESAYLGTMLRIRLKMKGNGSVTFDCWSFDSSDALCDCNCIVSPVAARPGHFVFRSLNDYKGSNHLSTPTLLHY